MDPFLSPEANEPHIRPPRVPSLPISIYRKDYLRRAEGTSRAAHAWQASVPSPGRYDTYPRMCPGRSLLPWHLPSLAFRVNFLSTSSVITNEFCGAGVFVPGVCVRAGLVIGRPRAVAR